ncbi:MAG: DUF3370 family protein [Cyanobacteriota bacterium]
MRPFLFLLALGGFCLPLAQARAFVPLMDGQEARPLNGRFNAVPVLHSNQPEEVYGPGILINTAPGQSISQDTGQVLANPAFTFDGEFGAHFHHKYLPSDRSRLGSRRELDLAAILINPGAQPVRIQFDAGAVRNSFEAPYLPNHLMGVKALGPRPWNTGPGDATAIQMLRGKLDSRLPEAVVIPPYGRTVLFRTEIPSLGIANALLRGRSDGPFQMAVVAAEDPRTEDDVLAVLDRGVLAPGRVYLRRLADIQNRRVFSRVGGVAIGDTYTATVDHKLDAGPLHVPLTSTFRHHFGTGDVQVNELVTRTIDSSVDNVGTYGVRFDLTLQLQGQGPYSLVLSHPAPNGRAFTAFRGSIGIETEEGYQEVHVGLRSGQSLELKQLNLHSDRINTIRLSLVYPADATPGHLLSVVPRSQLAQLHRREEVLARARQAEELRRRSTNSRPPAGLAPPNPAAGPLARRQAVVDTGSSALPRHQPPWLPPLELPPPLLINRSMFSAPILSSQNYLPASFLSRRSDPFSLDWDLHALEDQQHWHDHSLSR